MITSITICHQGDSSLHSGWTDGHFFEGLQPAESYPASRWNRTTGNICRLTYPDIALARSVQLVSPVSQLSPESFGGPRRSPVVWSSPGFRTHFC